MQLSKQPRGKIYLSGGMQFAEGLGANWRSEVSNTLSKMGYLSIDITELDIAYSEKYGHLYRGFNDHNDEELLQKKSNIRAHFVYTDLELITRDSDAIIIYYDESVRKGAGTISECQHAYNKEIPIFLVNSYDTVKEVPGWLQALSTRIFQTFEQMYEYLNALPHGVLCRDIYGNHHNGSHYLCFLCGNAFMKGKTHFVSKISPLYCKECVETVKTTNESYRNRYDFFTEILKQKE